MADEGFGQSWLVLRDPKAIAGVLVLQKAHHYTSLLLGIPVGYFVGCYFLSLRCSPVRAVVLWSFGSSAKDARKP